MLKKITEPQAIYQKAAVPGQPSQPVHASFTTPPAKKGGKFNWKIVGSILAVSLVAVVGVAGVLIAQRQRQVEGPVAPNAPESRPQAAIPEANICSLGFEVKGTPAPTAAECVSKTAAKVDSGVVKTPLLPNGKVRPGDTIEYTITIGTKSDTTRVDIRDAFPTAYLEYVGGSAKLDGVTTPVNANEIKKNILVLGYDVGPAARGKQHKLTYQVKVKQGLTGGEFFNHADIKFNNNTATSDSCEINLAIAAAPTPTPTPAPPTGVARCETKVAINPVTKKAYTTSGATVSSVKRGETIEYQLTVSAEKTTKGAVVVTDTLPTHLQYQTGSATGVTTQPQVSTANNRTVLTFNLGTLASSGTKQTVKITYKAAVKADAQISNFANDAKVVTAADAKTASSCKATLTVTPVGVARCAEKTTLSTTGSVLANETVVKKGDVVTYRIKVTATETTNGAVTVSDVLPTSVTYDSAITQGIQYNAASRTVTANLGVMGTTGTTEKTIEFKVKVNDNAPSGDFVNTASVSTGGANANSCPATLRIAYACNTGCTTDAQCQSAGAGFICSQEAGNKCRLANNTGSESCEGAPQTYSCNSSCTSDTQCQTANSNYVCANTSEGQRCRLKDQETQANCQAVSTPTPTPTIGCNVACATNADCTNPDHICYTTGDGSQRCRLDVNPTSASCTVAGTSSTPQPELPQELPQSGPENWVNWLKAGLITLGIGAALLLLL